MITIIDYDAGNIRSVQKACEALGEKVLVTEDARQIISSDKIILPGVGAFGSAMERLRNRGLDTAIKEYIGSGRPFLGICLGLQLLFEESEESPGEEGLGILKGVIRRIPTQQNLRVPHIGWNNVKILSESTIFHDVREDPFVYFVHSYYLDAEDRSVVCGCTDYGVSMDTAVAWNQVFATQFHPEKSGRIGLSVLNNFCKLTY